MTRHRSCTIIDDHGPELRGVSARHLPPRGSPPFSQDRSKKRGAKEPDLSPETPQVRHRPTQSEKVHHEGWPGSNAHGPIGLPLLEEEKRLVLSPSQPARLIRRGANMADHALMIRSDGHTTPEARASAVDRSRLVLTKDGDLRVTVSRRVGDLRRQPLQNNPRRRHLRRAGPEDAVLTPWLDAQSERSAAPGTN